MHDSVAQPDTANVSSVGFGRCVPIAGSSRSARTETGVALRPKTAMLLQYMEANPGRLLSRQELMSHLWPRVVVVSDSLNQCVTELRRALGDQFRQMVQTMPSRGYRFNPLVAPPEAEAVNETVDGLTAWQMLRQLAGSAQVAAARRRFELEFQIHGASAQCLTGIALSHVIDLLNRWSNSREWQIEVAREAADAALALDGRSALAHHARAHVAMLEGQHFEAGAGFRRAVAIDPSLGHAYLRMAILRIELGMADEAGVDMAQAIRCSRDNNGFQAQARFVEGMVAFHLGDEERSLRALDRSLALNPEGAFAHQWHCAIDALQGRQEAAQLHLARFQARVVGQTIESLQATERSRNAKFVERRKRFYEGLRRAGMPR